MVQSQYLAHVLWQTQLLHDLKMLFILTMPIFAYIHLHEKFALRFALIWIVVAFVIHLVDKNIYKGWFSQSCELKAEEIYDRFFLCDSATQEFYYVFGNIQNEAF